MKITKVIARAIDLPLLIRSEDGSEGRIALGTWNTCRFVVAEVHTDEGIVGYGEDAPFAPESPLAQGPLVATLVDHLGPAVIGMDPFCVEGIWKRMDQVVQGSPAAKAIIDMALYDIMGKKLGIPAYNLLGGALRKQLPLQMNLCIDEIGAMVRKAQKGYEQGFRTFRAKLGTGDLKRDMDIVHQMRRALPDDAKLRVDPNQAYSRKEALRMIPCFEEHEIEILEQPVAWTDIDGLALVNSSTHIPVMPHEGFITTRDLREMIEKDAAGVFSLKTERPGGITYARKARDVAELFHIPCVAMSSVELPFSTFAAAHLAATFNTLPFACELSGGYELEDLSTNGAERVKNGTFYLPEGPGLGVDVDEDKLNFYTRQSWVVEENSRVLE